MKRFTAILATATLVAIGSGALVSQAEAAPATGRISIIQAVPGEKVGVAVDDKTIKADAAVGSVIGPLDLPVGKQKVTFSTGGNLIHTFIDVTSGTNSDVVLHLPAQKAGAPLVNTYQLPLTPLGASKSRVLIAHAATVGAVDVSVDGKTMFRKVANGQFAKADVPAGTYDVGLTQLSNDQQIADFKVPLAPSTLSMVFAYAQGGEMKTIVDTRKLTADGMAAPVRIHTGSAGLAGGAVSDFGPGQVRSTTALGLGTLAAVVGVGVIALRVRRRTTPSAAVSRSSR